MYNFEAKEKAGSGTKIEPDVIPIVHGCKELSRQDAGCRVSLRWRCAVSLLYAVRQSDWDMYKPREARSVRN